MIFKTYTKKGDILVLSLIFGAVALLLLPPLANWAASNIKSTRTYVDNQKGLEIAEAGIDYYRWHLALAPSDYQDGSTSTGPYLHNFYDKDGNAIGTYTLAITAPSSGSTLVTINSTGKLNSDPSITKVISAQFAIPSLAQYATVANDNMNFGTGTVVVGPIRSNGGIEFNGTAYNVVSSAKSTYVNPDTGLTEFGVFTNGDPQPPASVPNNTNVFVAGREFPVEAIDFTGLNYDLSQLQTNAQASGLLFGSSNAQGYHMILKTNGTFDLYKVNTLLSSPNNTCTSGGTGQTGWGTWSIASGGSAQTFIGNYQFPSNGLIFFQDNVWVDGQVNGTRVTIAAGVFPDNPNTRKSITVNDNLLYTDFTGKDAIALVAQNNVNVGLTSDNTQTIDGALMAQNGRVGRFYYASACGSNYIRSTLNLFGMIATNIRYGFAYSDGTGYQIRNINYDSNFLYAPPPGFPLASAQYQLVSWKELK